MLALPSSVGICWRHLHLPRNPAPAVYILGHELAQACAGSICTSSRISYAILHAQTTSWGLPCPALPCPALPEKQCTGLLTA